ncbi:MAG: hypothetical protein HY063_10995 [Bacteroidetes bacterium]|nr:hypothetical protein [Bacteroidota bacterium]
MSWKKTIIGTGIIGGAIAGLTYFFRLKRTSVELESFASIKIHKLDLSGLVIRVDVQLKNPTRTKFKIKFPFIKLIYPADSGTTIGSSQVVDKDITIPAYGEAVAEAIMIKIPPRNVFSASAGMISSLLNGESVKLTSKTISTIDLGWKKLPYEKAEQLILKN